VAKTDSGQARRVADFLLAWHNAEGKRRWNPVDPLAIGRWHRAGHSLVTIFIAGSNISIPTTSALPRDRGGLESLARESDGRSDASAS